MITSISASLPVNQLPAINEPNVAPKPGFGDMLLDAAQGVALSLRTSEATAISGIRGDVGVREVAEAVMSAERQMGAAVAIRDKIVTAYLEISRMAI